MELKELIREGIKESKYRIDQITEYDSFGWAHLKHSVAEKIAGYLKERFGDKLCAVYEEDLHGGVHIDCDSTTGKDIDLILHVSGMSPDEMTKEETYLENVLDREFKDTLAEAGLDLRAIGIEQNVVEVHITDGEHGWAAPILKAFEKIKL